MGRTLEGHESEGRLGGPRRAGHAQEPVHCVPSSKSRGRGVGGGGEMVGNAPADGWETRRACFIDPCVLCKGCPSW